jgi:CRP-like cAMP-binding protein/membrane protease YdiL (CAAX protease family)
MDMLTLLNADTETWPLIRRHPIFQGIGDEEISEVLPFFRLVTSGPGEFFIREGPDITMDVYLILKGRLEVIKIANQEKNQEPYQKPIRKEFVIAELNSGDIIGELSFAKGHPRSASIKTVERSVLLGLNPDALQQLEAEYPKTSSRMMKNMVGYVSGRLKKTSENEVRALKIELHNSLLKSKANIFFSYVIGLLCVYNLTLNITSNLSRDINSATLISTSIVVVFCAVLYLMTRHSQLPLRHYGVSTRHWQFALKESMLWTVVIIAGLIFVKWSLIQNVERYRHLPLFDFDLSRKNLLLNFILYGLHCPVQEFIARGVLQGSLQRFFSGKNVTTRAVIVSNALFSATHIHVMGGFLGVIVFVPGLFWGWLYSRHDNLVGVSVSHILIGWTALFFLNLESLF